MGEVFLVVAVTESAVPIYCAEAKQASDSVISVTQQILSSKNAQSTPVGKKNGG